MHTVCKICMYYQSCMNYIEVRLGLRHGVVSSPAFHDLSIGRVEFAVIKSSQLNMMKEQSTPVDTADVCK